jgi:hypothetical protein
VCNPKPKGFRTLPQIKSNPPANRKNPTRIKGHNPREDLCPLIEQKNEKNWGIFRGKWVSGFVGNQWGKEGKLGGRRWVWVGEKGRRWCRRWVWWWSEVGVVEFGDLGEEGRRRMGKGEGVRLWKKMGERGKKSDLKAGHVRPKTEYVRTYISTFDCTRAGCMGVK